MNKYNAKKVTIDGIKFDSTKEANRYRELKLLEKAGQIQNLELQKKFELIPKQIINGKVVERSLNYIADFVYSENGKTVVEDVKGYKSISQAYAKYVIKRKLMLYFYKIKIREV